MREPAPALAAHRPITAWVPAHGDIVYWSGFITTWVGVLAVDYGDGDTLDVVFGNMPYFLVTMPMREQPKHTRTLSVARMKRAAPGLFAVLQHTKESGNIWYV